MDIISLSLIPRVIVGGIFVIISGYFAVSAFVVLIKNKTPFSKSKAVGLMKLLELLSINLVISGMFR